MNVPCALLRTKISDFWYQTSLSLRMDADSLGPDCWQYHGLVSRGLFWTRWTQRKAAKGLQSLTRSGCKFTYKAVLVGTNAFEINEVDRRIQCFILSMKLIKYLTRTYFRLQSFLLIKCNVRYVPLSFLSICSLLPTINSVKPILVLLWPSWPVELSSRLEDIFSLTHRQPGCSSVKVSWLTSQQIQSSRNHANQCPLPFWSGRNVVDGISLPIPPHLGRAEERVAKLVDSPDRPESEASYKLDEGGWADVWWVVPWTCAILSVDFEWHLLVMSAILRSTLLGGRIRILLYSSRNL